MLRKKLAVLLATAMMLFMVASPAMAAAGGNPPPGTCGLHKDAVQAAIADEEGPGATEEALIPPNTCKGN